MSIRLPGDEGVLHAELERRIADAGRTGLDEAGLASRLGDRWAAPEWREALAELEAEGVVTEWNRRWIAVRFTDWRAGRLQVLARGDALARAGERGEPSFLVPRRHLKTARDGDLVLVKPSGGGGRRRREDLPRATVVKVLGGGPARLVGTVDLGDGGRRWLVPFDPRVELEVQVDGADELLEDQYVVVALEPRSSQGGSPARGRVVEVLGDVESPGVDVEVILRHFGIPDEFPAAVERAAEALPADPREADFEGREDLRGELLVTVDGASARDFDDAIQVEERPEGGWRLGVHIADVSHYVAEGQALDLEAYRRGTSTYFPDRAVPMLPERLSNGLCSLRPHVPRLALSAFLDVDPSGKVVGRRFAETVIESARRLTYEEVARLLASPRDGDAAEYGPVLPMLRRAHALMRALNGRRARRGTIDFDLPEGDVVLDTEGFTVGVRPTQRTDAHRIIEELMIAANEAVALELDGRQAPSLYRVHDPPDPERLAELREILRSLGIALKGDLTDLQPGALQAVLRRVEGRPEEAFVSDLVLRSMQRAFYDPECRGHYALAARHYTHFTSPIRRYPDLLIHRQLKAAALGRDGDRAHRTLLVERLPTIAEHTSDTERRAERAERTLLQWKLVRWLAGRVGERFAGRITGVQPFGIFVQLVDYFVDGLVPIREMTDDFYVYDPARHRLDGRDHGRVFQLAEEVEVILTGVDLRRRGLNLRIADMPPSERERGAGRGASSRGAPSRGARGRGRGGDRRQGGRR